MSGARIPSEFGNVRVHSGIQIKGDDFYFIRFDELLPEYCFHHREGLNGLQRIKIVAIALVSEVQARADHGDAANLSRRQHALGDEGAQRIFQSIIRQERGVRGEAARLVKSSAREHHLAWIAGLARLLQLFLVVALLDGKALEVFG